MKTLYILIFFATWYGLTGLFLWAMTPKGPSRGELERLSTKVKQAELYDYEKQVGRKRQVGQKTLPNGSALNQEEY